MNDTRKLLNRIAEFRQRMEAMPRLVPNPAELIPPSKATTPEAVETTEAGSPTQAILDYSLRKLAGTPQQAPVVLSGKARRLLIEAQGLVGRLKLVADDPLLAGPAATTTNLADPLAIHFRETAAMTEAAVRYALTFPDSSGEQGRLCEGLEGMIDAARRRFDLLASVLERRRVETIRVDTLARFLCSMDSESGPLDPAPLLALAEELLSEEPGRPLRFASVSPLETQAYLGGPEYQAPVRFVAMHSLNCACVTARIIRHDADWRLHSREVVVAALLHDVGMLRVAPEFLAHTEPWSDEERSSIAFHTRVGAERILACVPGLSSLAGVAAGHHERTDGLGYPGGLHNDQVSPMARLIAAVDVYVAMCSPRPYRPAMDPRAALTDVLLMGENGRLDRLATERLLTLGLYPSGCVVELNDGSTAVVLTPRDPRGEMNQAAKPLVAMLADPGGRALANPKFMDLASGQSGNVVRALSAGDRLERIGRSYPEWA